MADDSNIKHYTAEDIEKYHKGQLSSKEMHDLEKASLDDPLLADALEGYTVGGINVNEDIAELRKRLADKTEQAKVIPMSGGRKYSFTWLRAAAIIVLIAGGGLLAYQFLFKSSNKGEEPIAQSPANKDNNAANPGTTAMQPAKKDSQSKNKNAETLLDNQATSPDEAKERQNIASNGPANDKKSADGAITNRAETDVNSSIASTRAKVPENKDLSDKVYEFDKRKLNDTVYDDIAKNENKTSRFKQSAPTKVTNNASGVVAAPANAASDFYSTNKRTDNNAYRNMNVFRGKVTDMNNNALPFANITNTHDNVGTYSDAQGNFALVSTDSIMNVQVKSLGFQNKNYLLQNTLADNKVVLQEDRSLPTDTIDKVKRNISRRRNSTMTLEEPEPEDGWDSYGSYVVNNLNIPETFETKKAGEAGDNTVEVSFDVNKNGEPVNIKVEKSLCEKCDSEAVRLIKDGPKWKRKKKSARAIVTVPFVKQD